MFEGGVIDWKPHGFGRMIWADGEVYMGHFNNGFLHGRGRLLKHNGIQVDGEWNQGQLM